MTSYFKKEGFFAFFMVLFIGTNHVQSSPSSDEIYFERSAFDAQYYLNTYPDVKASGRDPFDHFTHEGWKEKRSPRPGFDYNQYAFPKAPRSNVKLLESPKYYLSLVAIFRDEARFLKEWIEYYRMMGVEHFYLYNHLSVDNPDAVLASYIKAGIVDLKYVSEKTSTQPEFNKLQNGKYLEAFEAVKHETEWLMVVDTDEFMVPVFGKDIPSVLKQYYDGCACVSASWKLFGSGTVEKVPKDKLLVESLLLSQGVLSQSVKSIVKPRYVSDMTNPHCPILKAGHVSVLEDYAICDAGRRSDGTVSCAPRGGVFQVNHYRCGDWEQFRNKKVNRPWVAGAGNKYGKYDALFNKVKKDKSKESRSRDQLQKIEEWTNYNKSISVVPDNLIQKFVPPLRARMLFGFRPRHYLRTQPHLYDLAKAKEAGFNDLESFGIWHYKTYNFGKDIYTNLPADFDGLKYVQLHEDLNDPAKATHYGFPDLKSWGEWHYLNHGRHKGRQYKA
jgi:hypothetical protein